jgi:hypothetical protein
MSAGRKQQQQQQQQQQQEGKAELLTAQHRKSQRAIVVLLASKTLQRLNQLLSQMAVETSVLLLQDICQDMLQETACQLAA